MYRWMLVLSLIFLLELFPSTNVHADKSNLHGKKSNRNLVPDEATATRIAEAVWLPIYGQADLQREKPFKASLHNGYWKVEGTLPKNTIGGVASICISEKDGQCSQLHHGR